MYEKSGDTVMMCVIREREKKQPLSAFTKKRVDGNGISKNCLHGNGVAKQRREKKNLEMSQRASTHTFYWHNYMIDVINYFGLCRGEFRE